MIGYIYFLSNPSMQNMVKIGYSKQSVESRLSQLDVTGVPTPFLLICQFLVKNPEAVERDIHELLAKDRVNLKREFFYGSAQSLLNKSISIIFDSLIDEHIDAIDEAAPDIEFNRVQLLLLKSLASNRGYGFQVCYLTHWENEKFDSLEIEYELETLREKGLVSVRKSRKDYESDFWLLTSKGVKKLFDAGVLKKNT